jgi:hypothetical protein
MGLCFGTAGIKQANPSQLEGHLQNWLPYLELSRTAQGAAGYFGSKRNFGGDKYLGLNPLANATIAFMLASPEDNLFLFGGKTKGWFKKSSTNESVGAAPKSESAPKITESRDLGSKETTKYRIWTSDDDQYRLEAKLVKTEGQMIHLLCKDDGRIAVVPLSRLSRDDRLFVQRSGTEKK